MQHQHTFLEYESSVNAEWWLYENLPQHIEDFNAKYQVDVKQPLQHVNKSFGKSKELIDYFYDPDSKRQAIKAFEKDIELYESVKEKWKL